MGFYTNFNNPQIRAQKHVRNVHVGYVAPKIISKTEISVSFQPKTFEKWTFWPPRAQNHVGNKNFSRFALKNVSKMDIFSDELDNHVKKRLENHVKMDTMATL